MPRSSSKRSRHHLKELVESAVADEYDLRRRGLFFVVDEIKVSGDPPNHLQVWATLHFLPLGSPFCCCETSCHVPLYAHFLERLNDIVRRRMKLQQSITLEFVAIGQTIHDGVEFDDCFTRHSSTIDASEIDKKDALGRTALMRAAIRGHGDLVEELLAAGANPATIDGRGSGILEQVKGGQIWIRAMLETALAQSPRRECSESDEPSSGNQSRNGRQIR
jgi:hypothetical protein